MFPGCGAAQVVEQPIEDAGRPAGGGPRPFEIADGLTVPVEHQFSNADFAVRLEQPQFPAAVNQLRQITFEHDGATSTGFRRYGTESNRRSGHPAAASAHASSTEVGELRFRMRMVGTHT